jgi:hypothetical protein
LIGVGDGGNSTKKQSRKCSFIKEKNQYIFADHFEKDRKHTVMKHWFDVGHGSWLKRWQLACW